MIDKQICGGCVGQLKDVLDRLGLPPTACDALVEFWFHCLTIAPVSLSPASAIRRNMITQEITFGGFRTDPRALNLKLLNVCSLKVPNSTL